MELTIHIGPHKTGTTAIQTAFANHMGVLRRRGLLYPKTNWRFPAQHRLAFALKSHRMPGADRPDPEREIDELLAALGKFRGKRVFLSSEEFFACPPEGIERLRQSIDMPVRIVTFLRRPDNFLISCYNQKIKQPGNGFFTPIARFLRSPGSIAPEIDFAGAVAAWADVFGDDAICLETYEAAPPLQRIRSLLGLDALPPDPGTRLNPSVPGVVAECMRHAKAIGMEETRQHTLLAKAGRQFAGYPPYMLSDEDRLAIIEKFEPALDRLFDRFGQTNPYRRANFSPVPRPRDQNANLQDLMRLVDALL